MKQKRTLTEEHKRKIGEANRGHKTWNKNKEMKMVQGENHYKWKGGTHMTARRILKRAGINFTACRICKYQVGKQIKRIVIHHIDGNEFNNDTRNAVAVCDFCHQAIHGHGMKTRFKKGHKVPKEWVEKRKLTMEIKLQNKGGK